MFLTPIIFDNPPRSFADIKNRIDFLKKPHAKKLLALMPADIRAKFVRCYKELSLEDVQAAKNPDLIAVMAWFQGNSVIRQIVKKDPSSSRTFEVLYHKVAPACPVDEYFPKGEAAFRIYKRLKAIIAFNKKLYTRMLETREKLEVLSLCSGPNYGCIEAIAALPVELQKRIHLVNVDIDPWVIQRGREFVASLNLSARVDYVQADIKNFADYLQESSKFKELGIVIPADVIDLVGVICTAPGYKKKNVFFLLSCLLAEDGVIMPSIPMHKMIIGDPLTDFIMRISTWHMVYETIANIRAIAEEAGLKWHETYEGLRAFFTDEELDEKTSGKIITLDNIEGNHIMPLLTRI